MKLFNNRSEFTRNILTLVSGTGIAQFIALAASPLLTRLFTPQDFAPYTLFLAIVGLISVVSTGRFEYAILLPKNNDEAKHVLGLSLLISLLISLVTLITVFLYDTLFSTYFPSKHFSSWFYLLPLAIFFVGAYKTLNYWSTRNKSFRVNAFGRIILSLVIAFLSIVFGYFHFVPGLLLAFVIGNFVGVIGLSGDILKSGKSFFSGITLTTSKAAFKKYSDFTKINLPHALVDTFQDNGIVFFIAYYFSEALVGLYGFAFRILKAPLALIGAAFYQVFYQQVSSKPYSANEIRAMVKSVYYKMFIIGLVPFLVLALCAPILFEFIFGPEWREAGRIAQLLSPWLFLNFIVSPVSCLPLLFNRQKSALLLTCIDVVIKYSLLIVGGLSGSSDFTFVLLSIFGSVLMLYTLFWYYAIIGDTIVE